MRKLGHAAARLRQTGFFNIVGAGVLNKVVSFASGVILVRVLSKADYGAYSFALNVVNYFVLLNGLGTSSCVVQLCVERGEEGGRAERAYRAASAVGMAWDVALTLAIAAAALFLPLPIEGARGLLLLLAPFPLLSLAMDLQQQRLRSLFKNKEYALATNLNTGLLAAFSVGGALLGSSAGLSLGRSAAMAASAAVARIAFKVKVYLRPKGVSRAMAADLLKMAVAVCLTNAVSQLLVLAGTTLVGAITGDQVAVAGYAAATTIPFALMFLPSMVTTYTTPYFIKHSRNRTWTLRNWGVCSLAVGGASFFLAALGIAFGPWIVPAVFGAQYASSVPAFQILMAAFALGSTFRSVAGNVLAAHRRYGFNFASSAVSFAIAAVATVALVPVVGIAGAALGYALAMAAGSALNVVGLLVYAGRPVLPKEL